MKDTQRYIDALRKHVPEPMETEALLREVNSEIDVPRAGTVARAFPSDHAPWLAATRWTLRIAAALLLMLGTWQTAAVTARFSALEDRMALREAGGMQLTVLYELPRDLVRDGLRGTGPRTIRHGTDEAAAPLRVRRDDARRLLRHRFPLLAPELRRTGALQAVRSIFAAAVQPELLTVTLGIEPEG